MDKEIELLKIEREQIIREIEEVKEKVRTETGSFKYDDQYDDCIEIIRNRK
jgi:hypothetical protein